MDHTIYIAPNYVFVERLLGRKLHPTRERVCEGPEHMQGMGKGLTIIFMGDWRKGREDIADAIEREAQFREMAGALVIDPPWDRRQPKQQWGISVPQMWARQAGKRLAMERAWADTVEFYSWDRTKRSRWHLYVTRLKVRWGMLRLALARWIAGNQWPDPW